MNATFLNSAYGMLGGIDKMFVDEYVNVAIDHAEQLNEKMEFYLQRPIPTDVVLRSRGLLEKPLILAAIREKLMEYSVDYDMNPRRIIREMFCLAMSDMKDFADVNNSEDVKALSRDKSVAIKSFERTESITGSVKTKIVLHDKPEMLLKLATMAGLLEPDNPIWKQERGKPIEYKPIGEDATPAEAERAYVEYLEEME